MVTPEHLEEQAARVVQLEMTLNGASAAAATAATVATAGGQGSRRQEQDLGVDPRSLGRPISSNGEDVMWERVEHGLQKPRSVGQHVVDISYLLTLQQQIQLHSRTCSSTKHYLRHPWTSTISCYTPTRARRSARPATGVQPE